MNKFQALCLFALLSPASAQVFMPAPGPVGGLIDVVAGSFTGQTRSRIITAYNEIGSGQARVQAFAPSGNTLIPVASFLSPNATTRQVQAIEEGDFNRDGLLDVAMYTGEAGGTGILWILTSSFNGSVLTFNANQISLTARIRHLAAADIEGDGDIDLIAVEQGSSTSLGAVRVLMNTGSTATSATFVSQTVVSTGVANFGVKRPTLSAADMNGDGRPEILVRCGQSGFEQIQLYSATTTGTLNLALAAPLAQANSVLLGDLGGPIANLADLIVDVGFIAPMVFSFLTNSTTMPPGLIPQAPIGLPSTSGPVADMKLYDEDGANGNDLVTADVSGAVFVHTNTGAGQLATLATFATGSNGSPTGVVAGDFDSSGVPDFVTSDTTGALFTIFR